MADLGTFEVSTGEKLPFTVDVMDEGKPAVRIDTLPPGASIEAVASDPSVSIITPSADGLGFSASSEKIGTTDITVRGIGFTDKAGNPKTLAEDVIHLNVTASAAGALNTHVGTPEPE